MSEYKGKTSVIIHSPSEAVYAYLADFTRHPEWVKNVSKVTQLSSGPIKVGTIFKAQEGAPPVPLNKKLRMMFHVLVGMLGGAKPYSQATITALEPPYRIAWQAGIPKGDGFFNVADWEFVLEAQGENTQVTQHFHWQPQHSQAERMVSVAGVEGLRQAVMVNLLELKDRLEQKAR